MNAATVSRMPYPGLRSFRREESDLFFGREDCINVMVDRLAANHFLAVLGSSGTGKSSLVKTGLLDALDLGMMTQAGSRWRVVLIRPGSAPLANLARGLIESRTPAGEAAAAADEVDLLRAFLLRGPRSVVEWCRDGHLPADTNLLLLVDQFEELFRYRDYAGREEAEAFAALLIESARARDLPIHVALTMRSEYLGACALVEGLAEAISASLFLTPRMNREQCRSAIVGPAAVCGVAIDNALVSRLLNDLAAFAPWDERASGDQLVRIVRRADQLPLLQYCLNRMCVSARDDAGDGAVNLTLADYERIGGLAGALNAHADEILAALGPGRAPVAQAVFRALTDGTNITDAVRRPTRLSDLIEISNADAADVRAVVDAFRASGCNFLTPEIEPADPRPLDDDAIVDISHESLIRQWKRLSEWLEKEARAGRQWRRLLDRLEVGEPLHGAELANIVAWRENEQPNAAWAARYGGHFAAVTQFIRDSERQQRRFAPLVVPVVGAAIFSISQVVATAIWSSLHGSVGLSWAFLVIIAESAGATIGFSIWLYGGVTARRALLAGAIIFALQFASGALMVAALAPFGVAPLVGIHVWTVIFYFPVIMTVAAAFAPAFRRVAVWLSLTFLGVAMLLPLLWLFDAGSISEAALNALLSAGGLVWNAAIGFQLRRGADPDELGAVKRRRLAPLLLPLFGLLVLAGTAAPYVMIAAAHCVQGVCTNVLTPPWTWVLDISITSQSTAITIAFGLWRYGGVGLRRTVFIGVTMFVLSVGTAVGVIGFLLSRGMVQLHAGHVWYALLYPVCAVGAIAIFDPLYRRGSVWMPCVLLYLLPYGPMIWLYDNAVVAIPSGLVTLLAYLIRFSWFAALAFQLRSSNPVFWGRPGATPSEAPPAIAPATERPA